MIVNIYLFVIRVLFQPVLLGMTYISLMILGNNMELVISIGTILVDKDCGYYLHPGAIQVKMLDTEILESLNLLTSRHVDELSMYW